ncbi:MAG: hypothetical protein U0031_20495 [Thermomicrobiales bacterium]
MRTRRGHRLLGSVTLASGSLAGLGAGHILRFLRRRFLANPAVTVAALWQPLLPILLARWAGARSRWCSIRPPSNWWTVLWIGLVVHRRVLPLTWCTVPQQEPWPEQLGALLPALLAPIVAALPPGVRVTLLGDRGVTGRPPRRHRGRLGRWWCDSASARRRPPPRLRRRDGVAVVGLGRDRRRVVGAGAIFKGRQREGHTHRAAAREATSGWILFSTRPGGRDRVTEYARRSRVEATFADGKLPRLGPWSRAA